MVMRQIRILIGSAMNVHTRRLLPLRIDLHTALLGVEANAAVVTKLAHGVKAISAKGNARRTVKSSCIHRPER